MIALVFGLVAGLLGVHLWADVPAIDPADALLPAILLALWPRVPARLAAGVLVGIGLGVDSARDWLEHALPIAGDPVEVRLLVEVIGLPEKQSRSLRFRAQVLEILESEGPFPARRLQIVAYARLPDLRPGDRLRLRARVRPPRGLHNPGLFDYGSYLYQEGIHGIATVRGTPEVLPVAVPESPLARLDRARDRLRVALHQALPEARHPGVLEALVIGERGGMTREEWDRFLETGTNHLVAISGLHIGLIAGFFLAFGRGIWPWLPGLRRVSTPRGFGITLALVGAGIYAGMAGFSVPTQRALLMLLLYSLAASVGRSPWSWRVYAMAMGLVLVFDPRAILAPGFWFSFLAVASILLFLQGRTDRVDARGWLRLQWILSLLLLPLGIAWFQLGSWSAPLANLIAVPLVTFWVLPLLLLGSAFALVAPALGTPFILLADLGIRLLLWTLEAILKLPIAVTDSAVPGSLLLLSTLALLLLYLPAATGSLRWALLPLLPLLMPVGSGLDTGEFSLRLPDARAGQYIIVQTARHRLLFDPGPASGGSGGRPPGSVLALNQIGVRRLDGVIVSHAHRDHAGALDAVLERFPVDRLWTRQAGRSPLEEPCRAGDQWRWDGVHFEFLHPPVAWDDGPAASCVLRISGPGGSALLTGGLAGLGLAVLLRDPATAAPVDLLVLPPGTDAPQGHPLVARMQPEMVWVSGAAGAQTVPPQMAARDPAPGFRSTHADGQLRAWFRIEGRQFDSGSRHEHARFWLHRP